MTSPLTLTLNSSSCKRSVSWGSYERELGQAKLSLWIAEDCFPSQQGLLCKACLGLRYIGKLIKLWALRKDSWSSSLTLRLVKLGYDPSIVIQGLWASAWIDPAWLPEPPQLRKKLMHGVHGFGMMSLICVNSPRLLRSRTQATLTKENQSKMFVLGDDLLENGAWPWWLFEHEKKADVSLCDKDSCRYVHLSFFSRALARLQWPHLDFSDLTNGTADAAIWPPEGSSS